MSRVDSKGRIVLPKEVRERLDITPGTEVEVHEENGKAVVKPEVDPDDILDRMERLVAETSAGENESPPARDAPDPVAKKHRDAVRRGAERDDDA